MPFKVPVFNVLPKKEDNKALFDFFNFLFARWSKSDLNLERSVNIGDWDMDATASVTVNYKAGQEVFDIKRIRGIYVTILDDAETSIYDANAGGLDSIKLDATNITITRTAGGIFDGVNFDDTTIDTRGYVTIKYST